MGHAAAFSLGELGISCHALWCCRFCASRAAPALQSMRALFAIGVYQKTAKNGTQEKPGRWVLQFQFGKDNKIGRRH